MAELFPLYCMARAPSQQQHLWLCSVHPMYPPPPTRRVLSCRLYSPTQRQRCFFDMTTDRGQRCATL